MDTTEVMWPGQDQLRLIKLDATDATTPPLASASRANAPSRKPRITGRVVGGLAAVVALIVVGAVVWAVTSDGDTSPTTTEAEPTPTPDPNTQTEQELRAMVEPTVGAYTLVADSVVRDEDALDDGALAALAMEYAVTDGGLVEHSVARIRSAHDAELMASSTSSALQADGWILDEEGDVELESGARSGKYYVLQSGTDVQAISLNQRVVWSNGDLYAAAYAAKPVANDFYAELDY